MPTLRNGDVELYYEVHGSGTPLLLLAGFAADQSFWVAALEALKSRRRVILLDNRGAGRTALADTRLAALTIEAMADDCAALLRHLGLGKADVAGHSMGGMIALALALREPALVDRLVLASSAPATGARNRALFRSWATLFAQIDRSAWFRNLYFWVLSDAFFASERTVDALVQLACSYPYQQTRAAVHAQVDALARFDATAHLAGLRARTLVLAGAADLLFPVEASAAFAGALPDAAFEAVPGAAHSFPVEAPGEFTRRVNAFLD